MNRITFHNKLRLPFLAFAGLLFLFTACDKDDGDDLAPPIEPDQSTTATEDQALAEALWNDVGEQADNSSQSEQVEEGRSGRELWMGCANITVTSTGDPFPLEVELDFGSSNCTGPDGRERRGIITYRMTDRYRTPGCTLVVSTTDYHVNDYKIEGERTIINLGENNSGQSQYKIMVEDATITSPSGETTIWNSDRVRTWAEGEDTGFLTPDGNGGFLGLDGILDDVYLISGSANGVDRNGRAYEMEITDRLRVQLDCYYITAGSLTITPEDLDTRTVNYGDGTCDNEATLTIGRDFAGGPITITLR